MKRNKFTVIRLSRRDIAPLKRAAHHLAHQTCARFAGLYGVSYNRIRIGAARSRWGSCSAKGNLNFNYKIAALPQELALYIIVHEICHLAELNHSPRFWALVARSVPEYKALRRQLNRTVLRFAPYQRML